MQLSLVAGERTAHESSAQRDRHRASVHGRKIVDDARLQLGAEIGGGRELALGKRIHAVVFNNVNYRQIAPHAMHVLSDADGGSVGVTIDVAGHETAVGRYCS